MRVSAKTKAATKERILRTAGDLFATKGFDATTTRDIADASEIAAGTLFNYFQTKEAILASLAGIAIAEGQQKSPTADGTYETFEEALFAIIAMGLRQLKPLRKHLPALMETFLSPLAFRANEEASSLRTLHLEAVLSAAAKHDVAPLSPMAIQLYWTLYVGVLMFWADDSSPKQEDTLALIDDSLNMFVGWLSAEAQADPNTSPARLKR